MIFVHALGTAEIDAGQSSVKPNSVRKFALLLHLSAERGRQISRSALQELIYPDQPDRQGRHSLRELLYQVRQAGVHVEGDSNGIELASGAVRSDYSQVIEGDRPDAALLEAALGGFLPGYAPPGYAEAYSEWFEGFRARSVVDVSRGFLREVQR